MPDLRLVDNPAVGGVALGSVATLPGYLELGVAGTNTPGAYPFHVDSSGNITAATITVSMGVTGVIAMNGGTNTSASAPVIASPGYSNSASASQLSDLTRDYIVYLQIGTAGSALTISIGHTSAANDATLFSGTPTAGGEFTIRIPAGWWLLFHGTSTTIAGQVAVGC